jgi:hypothetical protein
MAAVSPDVQTILGRPGRTLEQFAAENRSAFL